MSDTRSPPLASSLPPGRRPWLPDGDRGPAGEGWRSKEAPAAAPSSTGRESPRGAGRVVPERAAIHEALERRPRPASLLRPQRQIGRKVALGLAFLLTGAAGGLVLGLSLRPGAPAPQQRAAEAPAQGTAAAGLPGG